MAGAHTGGMRFTLLLPERGLVAFATEPRQPLATTNILSGIFSRDQDVSVTKIYPHGTTTKEPIPIFFPRHRGFRSLCIARQLSPRWWTHEREVSADATVSATGPWHSMPGCMRPTSRAMHLLCARRTPHSSHPLKLSLERYQSGRTHSTMYGGAMSRGFLRASAGVTVMIGCKAASAGVAKRMAHSDARSASATAPMQCLVIAAPGLVRACDDAVAGVPPRNLALETMFIVILPLVELFSTPTRAGGRRPRRPPTQISVVHGRGSGYCRRLGLFGDHSLGRDQQTRH